MKTAPSKQMAAKMNNVPLIPKMSLRSGMHFTIRNALDQSSAIQKEAPKFLIFSGKISEITKNGRLIKKYY